MKQKKSQPKSEFSDRSKFSMVKKNLNFQIEDHAEASEDKYTVMFQSSPIGMSLSTFREGRLIDVNVAWLNLIGIEREEDALGKTTVELGLIPDMESRERILNEFINFGYVKNFEILSHIRNGSRINLLVKKKMIQISGIKYVLSTVEDITERKKAEAALSESEEKYRTIVETANEGIWILDADRKTTYVNNRMATMLGYTIDEMMTHPWQLFVYETEIPASEVRLEQRVTGLGRTESYEYKLKCRNGTPLWVLVHASMQYESGGRFLGSISLISDISDLKQKEIALKENELKLRELIDTKDKFFNIIAHDLKNPFTSLIGSSELLVEKIDQMGHEKVKALALIINDSSKNGYGILLNLLDWSRSQTGMLKVNFERINLPSLIDEQIRNVGHISTNKEIEIISLAKKDIFIITDKNIINTVIRNLISNAVKFSHRKGKVTISASKNNECYVISVKDNGIGISAEKLKNIFKLESKLSTPGTENEQGTGLGLKLCKEFIEKINGEIWVDSVENGGSEFKFSIPYQF